MSSYHGLVRAAPNHFNSGLAPVCVVPILLCMTNISGPILYISVKRFPLVSDVKLWNNVVIQNINFIQDSRTDFVIME